MASLSLSTPQMYSQVVIRDGVEDDVRLQQLLIDCIQHPHVAESVRILVAKFRSTTDWQHGTIEEPGDDLLSNDNTEAWLHAVNSASEIDTCKQPAHAAPGLPRGLKFAGLPGKEVAVGSTAMPVGSQDVDFHVLAAILLLKLCPNIEHLVYDIGSSRALEKFLRDNNYGRLPRQYLKNLRHVTVLPGSLFYAIETFLSTDPFGTVLHFHRLPSLETFSIRSVEENAGGGYTYVAVPRTSNLKSITILNSDMSSLSLAAFIRTPRALENFGFSNGGPYSTTGGQAAIFVKTVGKSLWTQRKTLKEIDISFDSRNYVGYHGGGDGEEENNIDPDPYQYEEGHEPDLEQDANILLDRQIEVDGPAPLCPSQIPDTGRKYGGSIGSLHDFEALKRLSIGVKSLLGPGKKAVWIGNELSEEIFEAPFRLIHALPKSLEFLRIRGYKKGEIAHWDDQILELMEQKSAQLPRLHTVEGVETRLWSDVDHPPRKRHDPKEPKRAMTSYFLFMQDIKPLIKQQNPGLTPFEVSVKCEEQWTAVSKEEKDRYEHRYNIDLARYYKQREKYEAGEPVPEISMEEAEKLYAEHLRTGTVVKGREGLRLLESVARAGGPVDPALLERAREAYQEKQEEDARIVEEERFKSEGPIYEWKTAEGMDAEDWVYVEPEAVDTATDHSVSGTKEEL